MLRNDALAFVFPVWWWSLPATTKGWIDRVWSNGWAYGSRKLPHRSALSHGPILGTIIRIIYFLIVFSLFAATVLYLRHRYVNGAQTTWGGEVDAIKADLFTLFNETDKQYLWGGFGGLCVGALAHTTADIVWSAIKRRR